eukprot:m.404566 g.404566  ORF g.404566 m.404566 type:complete len:112 (-) comp21198_c0_seq3:2554-2889(-)
MSVHGRDVLASTGVAINGCDVLPFKDGVIRAAYRSARVTGASSSPLPPTEPECLARRAPAQPKRHQPPFGRLHYCHPSGSAVHESPPSSQIHNAVLQLPRVCIDCNDASTP